MEQEKIPSSHGESSVVGSIDLQDGEKQRDIIQGDLQDEKHVEVHKEISTNGIDEVDS